MQNINLPGSGHVGPPVSVNYQYLPYTNTSYLHTLREAMSIIDTRIKDHQPCNDSFKALPGGRSFADIWADNSIWINFDPSLQEKNFAATRIATNDITLTAYTLSMGRWTVVATLVHELAHIGGAPGYPSTQAEDTLLKCNLPRMHDPLILGIIGPYSTNNHLNG